MNSVLLLGGLAVGAYLLTSRNKIEQAYNNARQELENKLADIEEQMIDQYDEIKTEQANEKAKTDIRKYLKIDGFMGAVSSFYDTTAKCTYTWYVHVTNTSASNLNFHLTYCSVRLFGQIQIADTAYDKYVNIPAGADRWIKIGHGYEKAIFEKGALKEGVKQEGGSPYCKTANDVITDLRYTEDCYCVLQGTVNDATASLDGVEFSVDIRGLCLLLHYASWLDENLKQTVAYSSVEVQWFLNKKCQSDAIAINTSYQNNFAKDWANMTTEEKIAYKKSKLK